MSIKMYLKEAVFVALFIGLLSCHNTAKGQDKCLAKMSDMTANPENNPKGVFKFDYIIQSDITHQHKNGKIIKVDNLKYYVNTQDGSIYFPKNGVPSNVIRSLTGGKYSVMGNNETKFEGAIFFPNGKGVLYMSEREEHGYRKIAYVLPVPRDGNAAVLAAFTGLQKFFNDIADKISPQDDLQPLPSGSKWNERSIGYVGETQIGNNESVIRTMYIDLEPTRINTGFGMVGFLVGVVIDWRIANCNRLVVFQKIDFKEGGYLQAELDFMKKANATFNASSYEVLQSPVRGISILNADSEVKKRNNKIIEFTAKKKELIQKLMDLQEKKGRCIKNGGSRASCNAQFDPKIKEVEDKMEQLNKEMFEIMGVNPDIYRNGN